MESLPDDALSMHLGPTGVALELLPDDDLLAASLISHEWCAACAPLLRQRRALVPTQSSTKVVLLGKLWSGRSTLLKHFVALHDGPHRQHLLQQEHLPIMRAKAVEAAWLLVEAIKSTYSWHLANIGLDIDPKFLATTLKQMLDKCSVEFAARDPVLAAHAIHKFWPPSPKLVAAASSSSPRGGAWRPT